MKTAFRIGLILTVIMAMYGSLWAQRRMVPMRQLPQRRSGRFAGSTFAGGGFSGGFGGGFAPISVQQLLNPVPGLGFDFAHLAAINRNLDVRALIDPVTQQRLALSLRIQREIGATSFAPIFFPWSGAPSSQQPVVVILQQPPATAAPTEPAPAPAPPPAAQAVPEQPVREVGEFVFVRRNGTLLFVAAFRRQDDRVILVTKEGLRLSMLVADLDVDATLRINEDRGSDLHLR
jgi:hypothetical protein